MIIFLTTFSTCAYSVRHKTLIRTWTCDECYRHKNTDRGERNKPEFQTGCSSPGCGQSLSQTAWWCGGCWPSPCSWSTYWPDPEGQSSTASDESCWKQVNPLGYTSRQSHLWIQSVAMVTEGTLSSTPEEHLDDPHLCAKHKEEKKHIIYLP